ncbi:MAG: ATP-binding protein [Pseudomonadota bacterium]
MSDPLTLFQAIAAREKASRLEAERLLARANRALADRNAERDTLTAELDDVKALYTEVLSTAPDGIATCDAGFRIKGCNTTLGRQIGTRRINMVGQSIDEIVPGFSDRLKKLPNGVFMVEGLKARRADGETTFPVDLRGHIGPIGDVVRYIVFVHDITSRITAEEKRKQIEAQADEGRRLEAIGALSAGIAHEINTPIQFIGDNVEFLREALGQVVEAHARFETLRAAVSGGADTGEALAAVDAFDAEAGVGALIEEINIALEESREGIAQVRDIILLMKDFAHPGSGKKKDVANLNDIVGNVVTISRHRQRGVAEVSLAADADLPDVKCRRAQIQQVILNLVLNAIDAVDMNDGPERRVHVETAYDADFVRVMISDTGGGVPDSLREKIFDPFFTTKPVGKGTGQGLALAKEYVVKGHDGRLTLIEREGFATTFLIELPRTEVVDLSSEEFLNDVA